jgi:hypothetical protein
VHPGTESETRGVYPPREHDRPRFETLRQEVEVDFLADGHGWHLSDPCLLAIRGCNSRISHSEFDAYGPARLPFDAKFLNPTPTHAAEGP